MSIISLKSCRTLALWCSCCFFSLSNGVALETRSLGTLEMILRSRAPISNDETTTMINLLGVTVNFLHTVMYVYFEQNDEVTFDRLSATVEDYSVREEDASVQVTTPQYLATVVMSGIVYFEDNAAADQDVVTSIAQTAFVEANEDFLKALWDTSSDPFLRQIGSAIVKVNSVPFNATNATEDDNDDEDVTKESGATEDSSKLATWMIALISGTATFCLVFLTCTSCIFATKLDYIPEIPEPPKTKSAATGATADEEASVEGGASSFHDDTNFGTNAQRSPSTVHSITSQDSSLFTYNPKSVRSYASNGSKTFGSGMFTANSGLDMDLQAWQNGGTVVKDDNHIPFGNDISAIENKKDLSLIQEEDIDDMSSGLNISGTQQLFKTADGVMSPRQYLTEAAVQDLEERGRWSNRNSLSDGILKTNSVAANTSLLSRQSYSSAGSGYSRASKLDLDGSSSDVINDLKDLSYQIDAYRQRLSNS